MLSRSAALACDRIDTSTLERPARGRLCAVNGATLVSLRANAFPASGGVPVYPGLG